MLDETITGSSVECELKNNTFTNMLFYKGKYIIVYKIQFVN